MEKPFIVNWLFPPDPEGGFPNISQYRFFKRMPIRASIIYPYLAAMGITQLKADGFRARLLDCPTSELSYENIRHYFVNADLVVMEARTPNLFEIWRLCDVLKSEFPGLKVALYGDHVSFDPDSSLKYADYIVTGGDSDNGVLQLSRDLRSGRDPPMIYRTPLVEDLDSLPFCDRKEVPWYDYYESWRHREKFFWTMSSRGCPLKCSFCAWCDILWNCRQRSRSPGNVADEFESIFNDVGEYEILDDADIFDPTFGRALAEELIKRGLGDDLILWAVQTHPALIRDLETLRIMRESGLKTVKLGVESMNQKTLNRVGKGLKIIQIQRAIYLLKEAGIMVHANLMVGFPWESRDDVMRTVDMIKELDPNQAQFSLVIPYPMTRLYEEARENGWLLVGPEDWSKYDASRPMLSMKGLTSREIAELYRECWSRFYFDLRYIWRHVKTIRHWEGIKQLWRGYRSIKKGHMEAVRR